jgi:hypothetical protein
MYLDGMRQFPGIPRRIIDAMFGAIRRFTITGPLAEPVALPLRVPNFGERLV